MTIDKDAFAQIVDEFIPVHRLLGITLEEIRIGFAQLRIPFRPDLIGDPRSQRWHGGIIATIIDSAGGAAGMTTLTSASDTLTTIDMRVDYLNGTRPVDLVVSGEIIRNGNRVIVTHMKAWHSDAPEVIVAEGRAAYHAKRKKSV